MPGAVVAQVAKIVKRWAARTTDSYGVSGANSALPQCARRIGRLIESDRSARAGALQCSCSGRPITRGWPANSRRTGVAPIATPDPLIGRAGDPFHDFGYLRYEARPHRRETGSTPEFRDVLTDAAPLDEYQWCPDWLFGPGSVRRRLVSMHRTGLWRRATTRSRRPYRRCATKATCGWKTFIERQETLRPQRPVFDPTAAYGSTYHLLQVWDLLSLAFSVHAPKRETFEPVPVSYADGDGDEVRLTMTPARGDDGHPRSIIPSKRTGTAHCGAGPPVVAVDVRLGKNAFSQSLFLRPAQLLEFQLVARVLCPR